MSKTSPAVAPAAQSTDNDNVPTSPNLAPQAQVRSNLDVWVLMFVGALALGVLVYGLIRETGLGLDIYVGLALVVGAGLLLWNRVRAERRRLEDINSKISAQSSSLAIAKAETDRIMETVQEGLFLVDEKGTIGDYHSRALIGIFKQDEFAGYNFFNFLQRLLSEKMFNTTKDYFSLLFDHTKKEKTVLKVNPLIEIEVNFPNPEGGFINRYLGFSFRRILEGGKVVRIFVAVRDITKQVELEKKLRESEKHKERQLSILLGIVHISPPELASFDKLVDSELETINKTLRAEDIAAASSTHMDTLRERLKIVFRSVHNIKGNAALLKLAYFQKAATEFEAKIAELQEKQRLSGDDFLSIVICEAQLRDDLTDLQDLREKLAGLRSFSPGGSTGGGATANISTQAAALAENLQGLVEEAARDLEKASTLSVDQFAIHTVSFGRVELVRDVLIQLTRNSLAHSVEKPADRVVAGKPPVATIAVRGIPSPVDGFVGLSFRDDGAGLNLDAIRSRATSSGLIKPDEAGKASPDELARCIFAPGFSTSAKAGDHSGRGMGMDIIKSKVVDDAGGILELHSTPGKFCEFRLFLPTTQSA
jgi:two-component system, chemotaxis family, sensor kinase CheA